MVITLIVVGVILFFAIDNLADNVARESRLRQEADEHIATQNASILEKLDKLDNLDDIDDWFLKKDRQQRRPKV